MQGKPHLITVVSCYFTHLPFSNESQVSPLLQVNPIFAARLHPWPSHSSACLGQSCYHHQLQGPPMWPPSWGIRSLVLASLETTCIHVDTFIYTINKWMKGYKHLIYIVLEKMVMSNEILNYIIYIGIFNYFFFDRNNLYIYIM